LLVSFLGYKSQKIRISRFKTTELNIELQPDNYVWIVDGYCNNGKRIRKQGTVLLVR